MVRKRKTAHLDVLLDGYCICAKAEGKSTRTIEAVTSAIRYFCDFLERENISTDILKVGVSDLRAFIQYLQGKNKYDRHPYNYEKDQKLSPYTINCYVRSIRAFWGWLLSEELIEHNPMTRVRPPKTPYRLIPILSDREIQALISKINRSTAVGYRDYVIILTLLDSGMRVGELVGLKTDDIDFDEGLMRVVGKGSKERMVPFGARVAKELWKYKAMYRPETESPVCRNFFLTREGRPLNANRVEKRMSIYKNKAGISGKRCSPHMLRHASATRFLKCGGDPFTLQKILGHTKLDMTRHYVSQVDMDIKASHRLHSPVDNMQLPITRRSSKIKGV